MKMSAMSQPVQAGVHQPCLPGLDIEDDDALAASLKKLLLPKKVKRLELRDRLVHINLEGLDHESLPSAELGNKIATAKAACIIAFVPCFSVLLVVVGESSGERYSQAICVCGP